MKPDGEYRAVARCRGEYLLKRHRARPVASSAAAVWRWSISVLAEEIRLAIAFDLALKWPVAKIMKLSRHNQKRCRENIAIGVKIAITSHLIVSASPLHVKRARDGSAVGGPMAESSTAYVAA